jgi:mRNA interferase MazF
VKRGDIHLAPFPYTDLSGTKRRPVCVLSSAAFSAGPDVVVAMVTSQQRRLASPGIGDVSIVDWQAAGLLAPSVLRSGRLWTAERRILGRSLGALAADDLRAVEHALAVVLDLKLK